LILQEEEVEKLDEMIASHEQQKSEKQGLLNDSQKEFDEAESKFKVVEQEMRSKAEGGEPLKDELGNTQVEIEQAKINKKHYEMKLKEQEKKIHDLRKKVDIYKAEIEVKKNILCSINMSILILNMYWNKSNANVWYQILE
jgi:chromosome segregation ATPase